METEFVVRGCEEEPAAKAVLGGCADFGMSAGSTQRRAIALWTLCLSFGLGSCQVSGSW